MKIAIDLNPNGEEIFVIVPEKREVCPTCDGWGSHLNRSIGLHAYTKEEFDQEFDDKHAEQYFRRGGIYDVQCSECHGEKVISVVDEDQLTSEQKILYVQYLERMDRLAQDDEDDRRTRWAENGYQE